MTFQVEKVNTVVHSSIVYNVQGWFSFHTWEGNPLLYFFRQSTRFNFRPSKQSSFYVFGVVVDSRGGNRARYLCVWSFYRQYMGDPRAK